MKSRSEARYERLSISVAVWNLYHDFSDEARSLGYLSCLGNIHSTNFPEETERLTDDLLNPEFREQLLAEYKVFLMPTAKLERCGFISTVRSRFLHAWKICHCRAKNITPIWRLFRKQAVLSPRMKFRLLLQTGAALRGKDRRYPK